MQTSPNPAARRMSRGALVLIIVALNLTFGAAALFGVITPAADARSAANDADDAILAAVHDLIVPAQPPQIQLQTDGSRFIDLQGAGQAVLLVVSGPDGALAVRCVTTVAEAAAVLAGTDPLVAALLAAGPAQAAQRAIAAGATPQAILAAAAGQFEILVNDPPGVGFNDPTPVAPSGGNPGTTLGEQRLAAFHYASAIWAAHVQSTVPIRISASFANLACSPTGGVLGSAAPRGFRRDFAPQPPAPGPFLPNTWYVEPLADKLAGYDLAPDQYDIFAQFNGAIGTPGCLEGFNWYYGFDGNTSGQQIDLIITLLHEIAHGLGFYSGVSSNGQNFLDGNDSWNSFLFDNSQGRFWRDMLPEQRAASFVNTGNVVWTGANVTSAAGDMLAGTPVLTVTAPLNSAGAYPVGRADFGPQVGANGLSGTLVAALDPADPAGPSIGDACSPLLNSAIISGSIALVDRGDCAFTTKARNAQDAGAIGVLIADNLDAAMPLELNGSDPQVTIPVFGLTRTTGAALRAAAAEAPVQITIGSDRSRLAGADSAGRVRMFAPNPAQPGSSIAHFDNVASPNLLMEPAINRDLDQRLDLTGALLRDIGWFVDRNYNKIDDCTEIVLTLDKALTPMGALRNGDSVTVTVRLSNTGQSGDTTVRLVNNPPPEFTAVTWSAAYTAGASGPAAGVVALDTLIELPVDSSATISISAVLESGSLNDIVNLTEASAVLAAAGACANSIAQAQIVIPIADQRLHIPLVR
jgi:hypothetical protein